MVHIQPVETSSTAIQDMYWVNPKQSPLKSWGTSSSDTWIMNMDHQGALGDYNTGYYNDEVFNYFIQDMEYLSGSYALKKCPTGRNSIIGFPDIHATSSLTRMCSEWEPCDASDWKCFKNRFILNDGITRDIYRSYFGTGSAANGAPVLGKPIGKTTFIATGSNNELIYPSNHYINYSTTKDQSRYLYYEKTPAEVIILDNNNDETSGSIGRLQFPHLKDLFPTQSFYSVSVEGADTENVLRGERPGDRPGQITNGDQQTSGYDTTRQTKFRKR